MQTFPSRAQFTNDPVATSLLETLESESLQLSDALLYRSFPLYRDEEGGMVVPDCLMLSPFHGVIAFALATTQHFDDEELSRCAEVTEQVPSYIHSKLIKNRALRASATQLSFEITPVVYAPFCDEQDSTPLDIINTAQGLEGLLDGLKRKDPIPSPVFDELVGTVDGAKGLVRPVKRTRTSSPLKTKGEQADLVEASITLFDYRQKHGMMGKINGPQRIRGLAGSGKTVVLAMKAAQTLLQNPNARIAYTFYTKSLYQHVKRLITRFYRQFDDRDPDWERNMHVIHGWGGSGASGLYSIACDKHSVQPLSYGRAGAFTAGDRFDYACTQLLQQTEIVPHYDYIFVDEGQDFPISFIRLCHAFAKKGRFVLAYDELQTIFQAASPDSESLFGLDNRGEPNARFEEDVVLHKCYRNPREILVAAHSMGFGIYGERIVQMIESADHWSDIGYVVRSGTFESGSPMIIERPKEHSLDVLSNLNEFQELVKIKGVESIDEEVEMVLNGIVEDLGDGLRPEDILVVAVDDRNAKTYLEGVSLMLSKSGVRCNNLQGEVFGIRDFTQAGRITLSTVHKAKGNEAFMVYVMGCDAIIATADVRRRNMLFTAVTRAKGWVRLSGVGAYAGKLVKEVRRAKENFPFLKFNYPAPEQLKVMKRDLAEAADRKLKAKRILEEMGDLSDEELEQFLAERKTRRGRKRIK